MCTELVLAKPLAGLSEGGIEGARGCGAAAIVIQGGGVVTVHLVREESIPSKTLQVCHSLKGWYRGAHEGELLVIGGKHGRRAEGYLGKFCQPQRLLVGVVDALKVR